MTDASRSPPPRKGSSSSRAGTAASPRASQTHRSIGELSSRTAELLEARGMDVETCVRLGLETASAHDGGDDWVSIPFIKAGESSITNIAGWSKPRMGSTSRKTRLNPMLVELQCHHR